MATWKGPGGGTIPGDMKFVPTGTAYSFTKVSSGSNGNTTNSKQPAAFQEKSVFTYSQPLFGPNAASFYGLVIPVSLGKRAIVGVPVFASQVYVEGGTYYVDFAMSIGYGGAPASELINTQLLRVWADGELVYDAEASSGWNIASKVKFKVYSGTEDQLPDPTLVKWLGAENGIAFRGQVYVMFDHWPVDINAPAAIPSIRLEVRDNYAAAANIEDVTRIGGAVNLNNIGMPSAIDWYRQRVYAVDLVGDNVNVYDMLNMLELYDFPTVTGLAGFKTAFYCEPKYGYLISTQGTSNSVPILSFDPNTGSQLDSFGVTSASLINTSGGFVDSLAFTEFTINETSMTDAFIGCIGFFGSFGVLHLDSDGALSYVWTTGTGGGNVNTVYSDFDSLAGRISWGIPGDVIPFDRGATAFLMTSGELCRCVITPAGSGGFQSRFDHIWSPPAGSVIKYIFASRDQDDIIVLTHNTANNEDFFSRIRIADSLRQKVEPDTGATGGPGDWATTLWTAGPISALPSQNLSLPSWGYSQLGSTHTLGYPTAATQKFTILDVQSGTWFTFDFNDFIYGGTTVTGTSIGAILQNHMFWNGDAENLIGFSANTTTYPFGPAKIYPMIGDTTGIPLYTILRWNMMYTGFDQSELDISTDLSDPFTGEIIEELDLNVWDMLGDMGKAVQFDFFESENKIKFTKVGRGAQLSIDVTLDPDDDLLSINAGDDEGKGNNESGIDNAGQESGYAGFTTERDWTQDIPGIIELRYLDETIEYTVNIARAKKTTFPVRTTWNNSTERLDVPLIMTPELAYQYAAKALYDLYAGQVFNNLRLGPKYLRLEPGDVASLSINDMDYVFKISEGTINADYSMSVRGQGFANIDDVGLTGEEPLSIPQVVAGPSITQGFVVDTPPLNPADCASVTDSLLRVYGEITSYGQSGWLGGHLLFSDQAAGTYSEVMSDSVTGGSYVGVANAALTGALAYTTDLLTSLLVSFSVLPASLSGTTGFLLVGQPGRWEFMSYGACAGSTGSTRQFTFTNLVRGLRGTEWHTRDHAAGDVVLVYPNTNHLRIITMDIGELNDVIYYKSPGINEAESAAAPRSFTENANFEKPWAPTSLKARTVSGGSSAIALSWLRRTRLETTPWGTGGSYPLEPGWTEQYEIEILSPSGAVLRTVTGALTNSYTYASGDITTDFGSVPATISFTVYQISPVVGRGFPGSITTDVLSAT